MNSKLDGTIACEDRAIWCVVTYEQKPIHGASKDYNHHAMTTASVFGLFQSRQSAVEWAESHPRIKAWSVKCVCETE